MLTIANIFLVEATVVLHTNRRPKRIRSNIKLGVAESESTPADAVVGVDVEVFEVAPEGAGDDDLVPEPLVTLAVRYYVESSEDKLLDVPMTELMPQVWPYLRVTAIDMANKVGFRKLPIPILVEDERLSEAD